MGLGINRYSNFNPVDYSDIPIFQPDFNALDSMLANQQSLYDKGMEASELPIDAYGEIDKERASQIRLDRDKMATSVADIYATKGISAGNKAMKLLEKTVKNDYLDPNSHVYNIQENAKNIRTQLEKIDAWETSSDMKKNMMDMTINEWKGSVKEDGSINTFTPEQLSEYVDPAEAAINYAKEIKPTELESITGLKGISYNGNEFIYYDEEGKKTISSNDVAKRILPFLKNNPKINAFLTQKITLDKYSQGVTKNNFNDYKTSSNQSLLDTIQSIDNMSDKEFNALYPNMTKEPIKLMLKDNLINDNSFDDHISSEIDKELSGVSAMTGDLTQQYIKNVTRVFLNPNSNFNRPTETTTKPAGKTFEETLAEARKVNLQVTNNLVEAKITDVNKETQPLSSNFLKANGATKEQINTLENPDLFASSVRSKINKITTTAVNNTVIETMNDFLKEEGYTPIDNVAGKSLVSIEQIKDENGNEIANLNLNYSELSKYIDERVNKVGINSDEGKALKSAFANIITKEQTLLSDNITQLKELNFQQEVIDEFDDEWTEYLSAEKKSEFKKKAYETAKANLKNPPQHGVIGGGSKPSKEPDPVAVDRIYQNILKNEKQKQWNESLKKYNDVVSFNEPIISISSLYETGINAQDGLVINQTKDALFNILSTALYNDRPIYNYTDGTDLSQIKRSNIFYPNTAKEKLDNKVGNILSAEGMANQKVELTMSQRPGEDNNYKMYAVYTLQNVNEEGKVVDKSVAGAKVEKGGLTKVMVELDDNFVKTYLANVSGLDTFLELSETQRIEQGLDDDAKYTNDINGIKVSATRNLEDGKDNLIFQAKVNGVNIGAKSAFDLQQVEKDIKFIDEITRQAILTGANKEEVSNALASIMQSKSNWKLSTEQAKVISDTLYDKHEKGDDNNIFLSPNSNFSNEDLKRGFKASEGGTGKSNSQSDASGTYQFNLDQFPNAYKYLQNNYNVQSIDEANKLLNTNESANEKLMDYSLGLYRNEATTILKNTGYNLEPNQIIPLIHYLGGPRTTVFLQHLKDNGYNYAVQEVEREWKVQGVNNMPIKDYIKKFKDAI
jgi:hypothetical protein